MIHLNQIKAITLGHAVADALGVPVEFYTRAELTESPVETMEGYGTYPYPAGCWSDDTSMSLCALDVLANGKCDFKEIMLNFGKWYYKDDFTPTGTMFDVGNTCSYAIANYFEQEVPLDRCGVNEEYANGNGSLMRIYPFVLYMVASNGEIDKAGIDLIFQASALTHTHIRSQIGCAIYAFVLAELIKMPLSQSVYLGLSKAKGALEQYEELGHYARIFQEDFSKLPIEEIKSGGYVVHTLEAAIWCLLTTNSYKECVLKAVNLGEDTDTVGAVAGSLAGALYGYDSIPTEWLGTMKRLKYIDNLCEKAYNTWTKNF